MKVYILAVNNTDGGYEEHEFADLPSYSFRDGGVARHTGERLDVTRNRRGGVTSATRSGTTVVWISIANVFSWSIEVRDLQLAESEDETVTGGE